MNWSQLKTMLWLRGRLMRNQWLRGGVLNQVVTIIVGVGLVLIAIGGAVGGFLGGYLGLAKASPLTILLIWDVIVCAFLFFWLIGVLAEIQRSESIDIARLLHLPVSLRQIFFINYLASHLTLSLAVAMPAMTGLALGTAFGRGAVMFLLLPVLAGVVFMVTAWTYCLRGWLVSLMVNQRRRRTIIVVATTCIILMAQLPNLYFNVIRKHDRHRDDSQGTTEVTQQAPTNRRNRGPSMSPGLLAAHSYVPVFWASNSARSLALGNIWTPVWSTLAALVIGGAGLQRAYKATVKFYQGQTKEKPAKPRAEPTPAKKRSGRPFIEATIPYVSEEAAALATASGLSMLRAPEVRMGLASSFLVMIIIGGTIFFRNASKMPDEMKPIIATGTVAFVLFGMVQFLLNQFGFDRDGFRSLVLSPARRKHLLLGKNLALFPLVVGAGSILLAVTTVVLRVPITGALAGWIQLLSAFLLVCIVGNLASIIAPYRIAVGSLKPTKKPAKTSFMIFLSHMLFPMAMLPIFFPAVLEMIARRLGWLSDVPINLILSVVVLAAVAALYRLSLDGLGGLLEKREKDILTVVTQEVE